MGEASSTRCYLDSHLTGTMTKCDDDDLHDDDHYFAEEPILLPGSSATKTSSLCGGSHASDFGATFTSTHGELSANFSTTDSGLLVVTQLPAFSECASCDTKGCDSNPHSLTNESLQALAAW